MPDCGIPILALDQVPWNGVQGRKPYCVSLELTQRCNNRCVHCYLDPAHRRPAEDRPAAFWNELLTVLNDEETLFVAFTGGEPLLRDDFEELYLTTKRLGMVPSIMTNARLVSLAMADMLAEYPPQTVSVSIYGATEQTYEAVSGVSGSFAEAMAGIERLEERGIRFGLKTMVLRSNVHELGAMRALAASYGRSLHTDPFLTPTIDGDDSVLAERLPPGEIVRMELEDEAGRGKLAEMLVKSADLAPQPRLFDCNGGMWSAYIDAAGSVMPCPSARKHSWGLDEEDLAGSFSRVFHQAMPAAIHADTEGNCECSECDLRLLCPACPGARSLEAGAPDRRCDFGCEVARARAAGAERL